MVFSVISEEFYPTEKNPGRIVNLNSVEPYSGYNDGIDQDCSDIRRKVFVGDYDPDRLDADGDGIGCESYGG